MNELLFRKTLRSDNIYKRVEVNLDSVEYFVDFGSDNKSVFIIDDNIDMDSLSADSKGSLWRTQLNPLGKKLAKLLDDEVHSLKAGLFATNAKTRIMGKGTKGKTVLFTPFMLVFDDGQVLTAQARNEKNYKKINASKPMFVSHWFLNEKDITDLVASDDPDLDTLADRISRLVEKVHYTFIKKNDIGKKIEQEKSRLIDKINTIIEDFEKKLEKANYIQEFKDLVNRAISIKEPLDGDKEHELATLFEKIKAHPIGLYKQLKDEDIYKAGVSRVGNHINALLASKEKNDNLVQNSYDFSLFTNITDPKEFLRLQEELEGKLEEDGVIDDYEEQLNKLDKMFASLLAEDINNA